MGSFFAELRRRHIYRVGAAYVVVAWGITQVIDVLSQVYALPAWIGQPVLAVLAMGLPVTLVIAWLIEGKAHEAVASAMRSKATSTDWVLASALVVVIGLIGYQQFAPRTVEVAATTGPNTVTDAIADEIVADVTDRLPNSVAVLPFENQSLDPENAFFASGVHDEIINQLSKLRNVNVIARTSVMQYPGSGKTIPEIADELNVETVMEGSVRYAGDQIRVTTQLIDGMTNAPVWTDEFDGDLSDIFGIQASIAMNIANSLRAEFSVAEQESIEQLPTDSPEAYSLFLKAMALFQEGIAGGSDASQARRVAMQNFLDDALALDPEFALAYAWKANVYSISILHEPVSEENWLEFRSEMDRLALEYVGRALDLNPNLGFAHAVQASVHMSNNRWDLGQTEADLALRLSPNDPEVLGLQSWIEFSVRDRTEEAIRYAERTAELDPNNDEVYAMLGIFLHVSGRHAEALEAYEKCLAIDPLDIGCTRDLASLEFVLGNRSGALNALSRLEIRQNSSATVLASIAYGSGLLGEPEDAQRAFEAMTELAATRYVDPVIWAHAYMGVGNYDEALNRMTEAADNPELVQTFLRSWLAWNTWSDPMLDEPEFVEVRERLRAW